MSRYWYLLNGQDLIGSCCESLSEYSGFSEALNTSFASTVELYNYDLSWHQTIQVIIQGNFPDSEDKSKERQMLTLPNICHAGMYVKYNNRFWLIIGLVSGNQIYDKAILNLCNYQLTWLNAENKVVQRWCCVSSTSGTSKNSTNETGNSYYDVKNEIMYVTLPDDDECMKIRSSTRFIIDRRYKVYEKSIDDDTEFPVCKPVNVYKLKKIDSLDYNYEGSGLLAYIAIQDEQQDGDGCYLIEGKKYWLCTLGDESLDCTGNPTPGQVAILCDTPTLYVGIDPVICTAVITNESGEQVSDAVFSWDVVCDFRDDLSVDYADKSILISTENQELIGREFTVVLHSDGFDDEKITVAIKAFI